MPPENQNDKYSEYSEFSMEFVFEHNMKMKLVSVKLLQNQLPKGEISF